MLGLSYAALIKKVARTFFFLVKKRIALLQLNVLIDRNYTKSINNNK